MPATKILWGQIITVLTIILFCVWGATEWVAWRLGFQPGTGPPWFGCSVSRSPAARLFLVVVPLRRLRARRSSCEGYIAGVRRLYRRGGRHRHVGLAGARAKKVETYGSARWAERQEVQAAGLSVPTASCWPL